MDSKELIMLMKEDSKWIIVPNAYEDRVKEFISANKKADFTKDVLAFLKNNDISYIYITCEGRDVKVVGMSD